MAENIGREKSTDSIDPIEHVVFLLMENHSFDQMVGGLKGTAPHLDNMDGVDPKRQSVNSNRDNDGNIYEQNPSDVTQMIHDPKHEFDNVHEQLEDTNGGFVSAFIKEYPSSSRVEREAIMGYYPPGFLPALHALAKDFTVCDHWFSSLPGPTWPNRFFALSGTCSGHVEMPNGLLHPDLNNAILDQSQDTIFDRLNEGGKSWKVYYYDIPCSLILTHQRRPANLANYCKMDEFFKDAQGAEQAFPAFTFIEPKYFGLDQNDDHPPHNVMKAEKLIADVYNAIRSNTNLWLKTLFVVLFDEHGGFYDHVVPPAGPPFAVAPDTHVSEKFAFDRLGVRVPAILASPWVDRRVESTLFDHTSLLKYLIEIWNLGPLGKRTAAANSIRCAFRCERNARPDEDMIQFIRVSNSSLIPIDPELEREDKSAHHEALSIFAAKLKEEIGEEFVTDLDADAREWNLIKRATIKPRLVIGKNLIKFAKWLSDGLIDNNATRGIAISKAVDRYKKVKRA